MVDHMLESSHGDDSNTCSNIGFGEEITQVMSFEINLKHLNSSSVNIVKTYKAC